MKTDRLSAAISGIAVANDDVDDLAGALEAEDGSPTAANHLVFEADARVVRAEAQQIRSSRARVMGRRPRTGPPGM